MKTKTQKKEELAKAKKMLEGGNAMIFADFTEISAEKVRKFRAELKKNGANMLVIKKRLLGLLFKEKNIDVDLNRFKISIGTIFSEKGAEETTGSAYKFFSGLEVPEGGDKAMWISHLIGGYDLKAGSYLDGQTLIAIGKLPPREVLLAQLLGMISAPIKSLLYVLDQKAKVAQ